MMKMAVILTSLLASNAVLADIYKYVDAAGTIHYTDRPKQNSHKLVTQKKKVLIGMIQGAICTNGRGSFSDKALDSSYKCTHYTKEATYFAALPYMGTNKKKFADLVNEAANRHQVDARLVHAVIQAESAYNASAISSAGAVGLMQLMPGTAKRYGVVDRNNPVQNIDGGTHYLKDLLKMFNSNLDLAVAAYNAGEGAVMKYNNSIPPYPETQNYVKTVLALYDKRS